MRKLLWFTLGFAAACALGTYFDLGNWILIFGLLFAVGIGFSLLFSTEFWTVTRVILIGCFAASLWVWLFHSLYLGEIRNYDAEEQNVSVVITDYSRQTEYGISADGKVKLNNRTYRMRLYSYDSELLKPGDRLEGKFRLYSTLGENDKYEDYGSSGIYLLGYPKEDVIRYQGDEADLRWFTVRLKRSVIRLLDEMFPQDILPFARALLLGDRSLLDYETNTDLSVSGIRHIVAVSGLHVSVLLGLVYTVFGYRRYTTPIIGWCVLLLFTALTGFTASVVRASIMHALMLGSLMLQREYDPPVALSFAVLCMLVINPAAVASIGLQLSAGCLIGIFLFSEKIRQYLVSRKWMGNVSGKTVSGKIKGWLAGSVSITLSTWIVTAPLCAVYFKTISLIGILTNLLTLWVVTIIFTAILALCVVGAIWLPLGKTLAWLVSWGIRYVLYVAKVLASFPLAAVYTESAYIVAWLVYCYVILLFFARMKPKAVVAMLICMVFGLGAAVCVSWLEPTMDQYRFSALDVGQGQCLVLQYHDQYYMVDCGGDSDTIAADKAARFLLAQGVTKLDGMILTHSDADHAGGVENFLTRIPVERVYISNNGFDDMDFSNATEVIQLMPDTAVTLADMNITILTGTRGKSDNETSMCVLFQPENCDILITGDRNISGERRLLEQIQLPDVEVLVAGHHGSKNATGLELLSAAKPDAAIISVSKDNSYGHPSAEVLERLALFGVQVLRTDREGTITIRG